MEIIEKSVYTGPNLYSGSPMIRFQLDLEALEDHPTDRLPGFADALLAALPGLARHRCSLRRPGGFAERMSDGTWLGHVIEHVALELQTEAGAPSGRGKTRSVAGSPGQYNVLYAYRDAVPALLAGRLAVELVAGLLPCELAEVRGLDLLAEPASRAAEDGTVPGFGALRRATVRAGLGPSTRALVEEAARRGIPHQRLDAQSLVRLGWGGSQRLLRASITGATSHLGVVTAGDKHLTKTLLEEAGIPVPRGRVVSTADEAVEAAARLRRPAVIKPLDGNHGRGVSLSVVGEQAVRRAFAEAAAISRRVIVEEQLSGRDYRLLVVDGRLVAAAERIPARVTGDGVLSVRELVDRLNADPRRGAGHENILTRVRIDADVEAVLARQGLTLGDVPGAGRLVALRDTANLSTGGEAIDRTDEVHSDTRAAVERAARIVGLDVAGLDVLTADIGLPLAEARGGIVEVNAAPGLRMHLQPSAGSPRNVAAPVIDRLFPGRSRGRIPIVAVTGTNGKSTTVRMVEHILRADGRIPGMTTTSGVYIGGRKVRSGDASGPKSARLVLGDPTVDCAVLETARGGILREGLAFDLADVGIVLNIAADHLGLKGIDTLEDMAAVKSVVVRRVARRGTSVLNADDPLTRRMARVARGRIAWFTSAAELSPALREHLAGGGLVSALEPGESGDGLVLWDGERRIPLLPVAEIPTTLAGWARFNVQNALAAAAATYSLGVPPAAIADALRGFEGSFEQNPGRLNITRAPGFTTILDYAHNPAALRALGAAIDGLRPHHDRVIGVVSTPGDRRDEDIHEVGRIAAGIFDELVLRERPDGRGRQAGAVVALLADGAMAGGAALERVHRLLDEREAMGAALAMAGPRDLVVLLPTEVEAVWRQVLAHRPAEFPGDGIGVLEPRDANV
ncbi:MAG: cyanophycin synthetase [Naasia sp.]|nr:cyanophycin synthetase [Naasia sp.]